VRELELKFTIGVEVFTGVCCGEEQSKITVLQSFRTQVQVKAAGGIQDSRRGTS